MSEVTLEDKLAEWNSWLGTDPNEEATIIRDSLRAMTLASSCWPTRDGT